MAKRTTDKGSDIPSTIQRSGRKAQETWSTAHDSAVDSSGEGERAHRTAFSALKHTHEKVGDRWEPKEKNGPSDEQAVTGNRDSDEPTAGGVDANASKKHLQDVTRQARRQGTLDDGQGGTGGRDPEGRRPRHGEGARLILPARPCHRAGPPAGTAGGRAACITLPIS